MGLEFRRVRFRSELRPGYGGSTYNIMEVDGRDVYRRESGKDPEHNHIKLAAGKKVPFKITYLTGQANGLGWIARIDIPGTLATVVGQDGRFAPTADAAAARLSGLGL